MAAIDMYILRSNKLLVPYVHFFRAYCTYVFAVFVVHSKHRVWQQKPVQPSAHQSIKQTAIDPHGNMPRPKIEGTEEERKERRRNQVADCKRRRKEKEPDKVKTAAKDQRWHYRLIHPESVETDNAKKREKYTVEKNKKQKARRLVERKAIQPLLRRLCKG